ncbi:hypothetical protein M408DRAFT_181172 [Serendipita vermifera MAFF 305830]|uniref:Uncharacterized protein n=1 Tax=Serendipita vermifera MAFF 305830 TaxID=933852 RepID=A0A0C2XBL6_SERVB|nr:hypothetical protein M408DRAFT_181172 [Serendipita vermifera MAFF 305830]
MSKPNRGEEAITSKGEVIELSGSDESDLKEIPVLDSQKLSAKGASPIETEDDDTGPRSALNSLNVQPSEDELPPSLPSEIIEEVDEDDPEVFYRRYLIALSLQDDDEGPSDAPSRAGSPQSKPAPSTTVPSRAGPPQSKPTPPKPTPLRAGPQQSLKYSTKDEIIELSDSDDPDPKEIPNVDNRKPAATKESPIEIDDDSIRGDDNPDGHDADTAPTSYDEFTTHGHTTDPVSYFETIPMLNSRDWDLAIQTIADVGEWMTPEQRDAWQSVFTERVDGKRALSISFEVIRSCLTQIKNDDYGLSTEEIERIKHDLQAVNESTRGADQILEPLVNMALNVRTIMIDQRIAKPLMRLQRLQHKFQYVVTRHLNVNQAVYLHLKNVASFVDIILALVKTIPVPEECPISALVTRYLGEWSPAAQAAQLSGWRLVDADSVFPQDLPHDLMAIVVDVRQLECKTVLEWCRRGAARVVILVSEDDDKELSWSESLALASCLHPNMADIRYGGRLAYDLLMDLVKTYVVTFN